MNRYLFFLVPLVGVEPTRMLVRQILSLLRLPVSPQRHLLTKSSQMRELSENFARILGQRKNQFLGFIKDTANGFQKKCA